MSISLTVAVGIILKQGQILLSERAAHKPLGPCWEFPGGKMETGETPLMALRRELLEEIGIIVIAAEALPLVHHSYNECEVTLHPWLVTDYQGHANGREGQALKWVEIGQLETEALPAANQLIRENLSAYMRQHLR